MQTSSQLPTTVAELQAMLSAQFAAIATLTTERDAYKKDNAELRLSKINDSEEIKRLSLLIAKLKRMVFGQKSEKLSIQIAQLEIELEELHITQGLKLPVVDAAEFVESIERNVPKRRPLPEHLPRDTLRICLPRLLALIVAETGKFSAKTSAKFWSTSLRAIESFGMYVHV